MSKLIAEEVKRIDGWYTHSAIKEWQSGREFITYDELNSWLRHNGMTFYYDDLDYEHYDSVEDLEKAFSNWNPECAHDLAEGWFIAFIWDTEDGAICLWVCKACPCGCMDETEA